MLIISPENNRFSYSSISFELANEMSSNDEQDAEIESNNALFQIVVELLSEKTEFARNYLDNPQFQAFVNQRVFNQAYTQAQKTYPTFDAFDIPMMAAEP